MIFEKCKTKQKKLAKGEIKCKKLESILKCLKNFALAKENCGTKLFGIPANLLIDAQKGGRSSKEWRRATISYCKLRVEISTSPRNFVVEKIVRWQQSRIERFEKLAKGPLEKSRTQGSRHAWSPTHLQTTNRRICLWKSSTINFLQDMRTLIIETVSFSTIWKRINCNRCNAGKIT